MLWYDFRLKVFSNTSTQNLYKYKFCVEVFEKTLSRTKMIDHSFERKFYGAYNTLCKKCCARVECTKRAHKVLKWDFHYDAIYQSVRKLHHSIFCRFLKNC